MGRIDTRLAKEVFASAEMIQFHILGARVVSWRVTVTWGPCEVTVQRTCNYLNILSAVAGRPRLLSKQG